MFTEENKVIWWVIGWALTITLIGFIISNVLNNTQGAINTISVNNIKRLSAEANGMYTSLEGKLETINTYQNQLDEYYTLYGENTSNWPQGKREEYQQLSKLNADLIKNYNMSCSSYEALWLDEWQNLPAPDDLPKTCEHYGN